MIDIYKELCTISECNAFIVNRCKCGKFFFSGRGCIFFNLNLFIAFNNSHCSFKKNKKSDTAGINNVCLFKDRKHLLCLKKNFMSVLKNCLHKFNNIAYFIAVLHCTFAHDSCYRKNCSFFRFHNRLISCCCCTFTCLCQNHRIDLFMFSDLFCKPSEQL